VPGVVARQRDYRAEEARRNERARAAGFTSRAQERSIRDRSQTWSNRHAERAISTYESGASAAWTRAYYDAFVNPETSFSSLTGGKRSTPEIRHFFVDVEEYMTPEEFDMKYGTTEQ
jgi:hypothetical protein